MIVWATKQILTGLGFISGSGSGHGWTIAIRLKNNQSWLKEI